MDNYGSSPWLDPEKPREKEAIFPDYIKIIGEITKGSFMIKSKKYSYTFTYKKLELESRKVYVYNGGFAVEYKGKVWQSPHSPHFAMPYHRCCNEKGLTKVFIKRFLDYVKFQTNDTNIKYIVDY